MKRFLTALVATAAMLAASSAHASNTGAGTVSNIHVLEGGVVLFTHNGTRSAVPGCATVSVRWAFDSSTPAGQSKLAMLLTAYSTKQPIVVHGKGSCVVWSDTETMDFMYTFD
jgi:hypothetical protein